MIGPRFDWAQSFLASRALVQIGERWGYIDRTGTLVIPATFIEASGFYEGLAHVAIEAEKGNAAGTNGTKLKHGYIGPNGNFVINPVWDHADDFSEGPAIVHETRHEPRGTIAYGSIIDRTGKKVGKVSSNYVFGFYEHVLIVQTGRTDKNFTTYTYLDRTGKRVTDKEFEYLGTFSEGPASARIDDKYGYIDKSGTVAIKPQFESARNFSDGLAGARLTSEKYGYIDRTGKFVVQPSFDWTWEFKNGFALVATERKTGYIDKSGQTIWKPTREGTAGCQWGRAELLNARLPKHVPAYWKGLSTVTRTP